MIDHIVNKIQFCEASSPNGLSSRTHKVNTSLRLDGLSGDDKWWDIVKENGFKYNEYSYLEYLLDTTLQ